MVSGIVLFLIRFPFLFSRNSVNFFRNTIVAQDQGQRSVIFAVGAFGFNCSKSNRTSATRSFENLLLKIFLRQTDNGKKLANVTHAKTTGHCFMEAERVKVPSAARRKSTITTLINLLKH